MPKPRHRLNRSIRAPALAVFALLCTPLVLHQARAETVVALPGAECRDVRNTLELYVPIAPGFRQLDMPFPENEEKIEGTLCRLVAVGTGVHVENERVRTLKDMQGYIKGALTEAGWRETDEPRVEERDRLARAMFELHSEAADRERLRWRMAMLKRTASDQVSDPDPRSES